MPFVISKSNQVVAIFALMVIALIFQALDVLRIGHITPGWILIGMFVAPFALNKRSNFAILLLLLVGVSIVYFLWFPFHLLEITVLAVMSISIYGLKKFFVGNPFFNIITTVFVGTVMFYLVLFVLGGSGASSILILGEAFFNMLIGAVVGMIITM